MRQMELLNRESNIDMNNVDTGKRSSWNTALFVANTITSNVTLDGIRRDWRRQTILQHTNACMCAHTHLSAGLLMFAGEIIEAGRYGVDLSLHRETQALVVLLGDKTLFCSLLGL